MMGTDTNERENKDLAAKEHRERKAATKEDGGWKAEDGKKPALANPQ